MVTKVEKKIGDIDLEGGRGWGGADGAHCSHFFLMLQKPAPPSAGYG